MKVLSIKEPYASLIMNGDKKIETRSFKTNYRGPLYIHASGKKIDFTNSVIIFENRNLENEKKLGFTNDDKSNLNLPCEIKDKVFDVIELKKLTNKDKEEILINKINNLIKNYDDAKVKLPAHYKEEILKKCLPKLLGEL